MSITITSILVAIAAITIITFSIGFRFVSIGTHIGLNIINSITKMINWIGVIILIIAFIIIIQSPEIIAAVGNIIEIIFK